MRALHALVLDRACQSRAADVDQPHSGREAGHQIVLGALGLEPILDLRLRAGEGAGAALAVTVLRAGLRIRHQAAQVRQPRDLERR